MIKKDFNDKILTKEELIELFENEDIKDTGKGWFLENQEIDIVAIHEVEPKYLQDVANAKTYKIIYK